MCREHNPIPTFLSTVKAESLKCPAHDQRREIFAIARSCGNHDRKFFRVVFGFKPLFAK